MLSEENKNVYLSSRNLKKAKVVNATGINTYSVLNANKVVIAESTLEEIQSNLSK